MNPARQLAMLEIAEADLPPTARNLVRLVGWSGAFALLRELRGARIYCPASGPDEAGQRFCRVAELAGADAARRIYAEYRGSVLEIPSCREALALARNRALRRAFDQGARVEALCVDFGLSRRRVFEILKTSDSDSGPGQTRPANIGGQMGLF